MVFGHLDTPDVVSEMPLYMQYFGMCYGHRYSQVLVTLRTSHARSLKTHGNPCQLTAFNMVSITIQSLQRVC